MKVKAVLCYHAVHIPLDALADVGGYVKKKCCDGQYVRFYTDENRALGRLCWELHLNVVRKFTVLQDGRFLLLSRLLAHTEYMTAVEPWTEHRIYDANHYMVRLLSEDDTAAWWATFLLARRTGEVP